MLSLPTAVFLHYSTQQLAGQAENPTPGLRVPAWHPGYAAAVTLRCTAMKNCAAQGSINATRVLKKPKEQTERDKILGREDGMYFITTRTQKELET